MMEHKWQFDVSTGDEWNLELPLTITGEEAKGLNMFLKEFFDCYQDYSIGDFYAEPPGEIREEKGGYVLERKVWLTPFELGVSQKIYIITEPAKENLYKITLKLHRESGDINSWKRTNPRFLNILRKQFLHWGKLPQKKREEYQKQYKQ